MSQNEEIIILRRVEDDAPPKKGGVWKIAHADFMTAMMAFFLIMWLVNATDEEIKKSIANYFNPMNLMSAPVDSRGISDPREDATPPASGDHEGQRAGDRPNGADTPGDAGSAEGGGNVEDGNERTMASAGILEETDNAAFNDPFATVASAAADIDPEQPTSVDAPQSTLGAEGTTLATEETRDPFDPAYWQTVQTRAAQTLRPGRADSADVPPPDATVDAAAARPRGENPEPGPSEALAQVDTDAAQMAEAQTPGEERADGTEPAFIGPRSSVAEAILAQDIADNAQDTSESAGAADAPSETPQTRAAAIAAEALAELQEALAGASARVSVAEGEGPSTVLISLTDENAFSMFPIGSADPTTEADDLFARVGGVLSARDGSIVVRGHTDARPFRGGTSDNWTLSFARAHATKTALARNGVADTRFIRVEGLADREPANPDDPLADENRRIEILYEPAVDAL